MTLDLTDGDETITALFWAIRHLPPSAEEQKAAKADLALAERIRTASYREMTRDEKRLARHYDAVHAAYVERVLAAYRNA